MTSISSVGKITRAINALSTDREVAAELLWDQFFERLCRFAQSRISMRQQRLIDNEAIAASAMFALLDGIENGRFDSINNRNELWRMLMTVAARKASNARRHHDCLKRGGGRVRGDSVFIGAGGFNLVTQPRHDTDPADCVEVELVCEELLSRLPDDVYRQIALLKMAGFSNQEISGKLGCTTRTIERKMNVVQKLSSSLLTDGSIE